MLNLIPKAEKKKIIRNFYYRLVVLFFLVAGLITLIAFCAILPSYFLSLEKYDAVNTKLEEQKREPVVLPNQETLLAIEDLDNKLNIIEEAWSNKFIVSEKAINAVISKKIPGIKITDISYNNDPTINERKIGVEGIAPSREALLLFRQAFEDDANFKQVDLPISNFVKGTNIRFYLSLISRPNGSSVGQVQ